MNPGDEIIINLLPGINAQELLLTRKAKEPKTTIKKHLNELLPKALVLELEGMCWPKYKNYMLAEISKEKIEYIGNFL